MKYDKIINMIQVNKRFVIGLHSECNMGSISLADFSRNQDILIKRISELEVA
jgi:hypothetical protein